MKYFSTFSGIGGFEYGVERAWDSCSRKSQRGSDWPGLQRSRIKPNTPCKSEGQYRREHPYCVGFSEIDKYATAIYQYHYPNHKNHGDITNINVRELPDFDLFVGGFPCQAFSIAGKRQGFKDTRGTLFFDVARILKAKQPEWVLLENVKGLLSHEGGKTLGTIYRVLTDIGYTVGWEVVNSCHFGVPQNRERIFIVGHLTKTGGRTSEVFPIREGGGLSTKVDGQGQEGSAYIASTLTKNYHKGVHGCGETYISGTWRTHKDGEGFREVESGLAPTIPARAREDGSGQPVIKAVLTPDRLEKRQNGRRFKDHDEPSFTLTSQDKHGVQIDHSIRRLTPVECERLQAFPDSWTEKGIIDGKEVDISDTQRYKTLGNSVTTKVVEAVMKKIMNVHYDS